MFATAPKPVLLTSKQHFEILDGLRGVAAIGVLIYHFMELVIPDYHNNFISHGHLAVDFFFCLSGFVIAYAYDNRIRGLGTLQFLKLRLIRLHPLVVTGSVLGLLSFLVDPFYRLSATYSPIKIVGMFITSCLLVPYQSVPERYANFFHLNPPTWSLFWEYVANIFYAVFLFKLCNKRLWMLLFVAAILLCYESYRSGYLGVGWGGENFIGGGVRVFYSFLAGMLVYRSKWIIRSRIGFVPMSLLLFIVFLIPFSTQYNKITEPIVVLFYFPFLIALGAGARLAPGLTRACRFLGNISYPLYMTHYPFLWIFLGYLETYKPGMGQMAVVVPAGILLLTGFAYLVMVYVDEPLRRYFKKKMQQQRS